MRSLINILSYGVLILFASCKPGFESIDYGKEACAHCKMTIVDPSFAAEMLTAKGKTYKFDDVTCMKQFAAYYTDISKGATYFVADYSSDKGEFINAESATYLQHDFFASPMNGNAVAFSSAEQAKHLQDSLSLQPISWNNIK